MMLGLPNQEGTLGIVLQCLSCCISRPVLSKLSYALFGSGIHCPFPLGYLTAREKTVLQPVFALQIHTSKMSENSFLAQDVDLAELAGEPLIEA